MSGNRERSALLLAGITADGPSMSRYALELSSSLRGLAEHPYAISLDHPVQPRYLARILDAPQTRRLDSAWFRYVAYPRAVRQHSADVFHILDHGYAQLIDGLPPDRTVITCHDLVPLLGARKVIPVDIPRSVAWTFRRRLSYLERARKIITDSEATKQTLARYTRVRPRDIAVVPLGVVPAFRPMENVRMRRRSEAGLQASSRVLLHVSTAVRYKNTPAVLHAFARIRARLTDAVLVRIGAPLFPDEARLAADLGIAGAIRYLGRVDDQTLVEWYNAADVLLFPSHWEGFGWPALEAMACGTPVVASDIPALAKLVGDAGVLAPADNPAALADAAERILSDRSWAANLRQRGLDRARHYSWERTAAATAAVYDSVLLESAGNPGVRC